MEEAGTWFCELEPYHLKHKSSNKALGNLSVDIIPKAKPIKRNIFENKINVNEYNDVILSCTSERWYQWCSFQHKNRYV